MMNKKLLSIIFLFSLIISFSDVFAVGALFSRPRFSDVDYQKMWIKSVNTTIDIQEQIAVTHLDQIFFNELNASVEAVFIFPLPENATITELVYWVNGQRFIADIRERQAAVNDYNEKLRQWLDPALLEYLGDNLFRLKIVPIDALTDVRTEITYIEPLKYDFGKVKYKFQLNTLGLSSKPLNIVTVNLNAKTNVGYESFESPSHGSSPALQINQISDKNYTLFYGDENFYPDKDLEVEFKTLRSEVDFNIITYKPSPEDSIGTDSYYALWVTPPDMVNTTEVIPQSIVFTVDVSSSMEGKRIEQVKSALNYFLDLLNPGDNFNIVTFSTFVEKYKPDLIAADAASISNARNYVSQLFALGLTNIDDALKTSLQQSFGEQTHNNIVFLTDGDPTWGVTNHDSIIANSKKYNTNDIRIFSFGVGEKISKTLLDKISKENHGYATFISADDSIATVVNDHFRRISKPVLTDLSITIDGLTTWDVYPKKIYDLFWGSQLLYIGKYDGTGSFNVSLKGKVRGGDFDLNREIFFPDTTGGHKFVPRLWAKEKINHILELIEIYGETDELKNQVIELSLMYQILTPYTAFYSDPAVTIVKDEKFSPDKFELLQNYPNPFNPSTIIKYNIPAGMTSSVVKLCIYNLAGELIKVLVNGEHSTGLYSVIWNGTNSQGLSAPSGVYFYTLESGNYRITKKMILVR
ncbi:MAG: VWA domain-containing protein [Bacteroidetes bacterium]|nr:VWA domain-containing protein [Bacteroidota bacterium]